MNLLKSKVEHGDYQHGDDTEHHDANLVGRDALAAAVEPVVPREHLVVSPRHHQTVLDHLSRRQWPARPSPMKSVNSIIHHREKLQEVEVQQKVTWDIWPRSLHVSLFVVVTIEVIYLLGLSDGAATEQMELLNLL